MVDMVWHTKDTYVVWKYVIRVGFDMGMGFIHIYHLSGGNLMAEMPLTLPQGSNMYHNNRHNYTD
jgi:hypothetical protein